MFYNFKTTFLKYKPYFYNIKILMGRIINKNTKKIPRSTCTTNKHDMMRKSKIA